MIANFLRPILKFVRFFCNEVSPKMVLSSSTTARRMAAHLITTSDPLKIFLEGYKAEKGYKGVV